MRYREKESILGAVLTEEAASNHTFTWKTHFHADFFFYVIFRGIATLI